jgi:mannose-1-phosphate guanylyltransferase/mannose-1-phosphate guanylyltransferase/mannose-6-phosphate isomerase
MSQNIVTPVILCGGIGSRLWPRSRASKPKPFIPLIGPSTLFEATVARAAHEHGFTAPVIVTGTHHVDHVEAQLGKLVDATIVVEPASRNTAAAIALAALQMEPDTIMLVCPSDHHIADSEAFRVAAHCASDLAADGFLVSFGIEPKSPETGFGYLERGEALEHGGFRVARFIEKPDRARAEAFVAAGNYAWNGGIFAFRVGTFLGELAAHRPAIFDAVCAAHAKGSLQGRQFHPDASQFNNFTPESVDYAVMENTDRAAMVPVDMGWSDIGSWDALHSAIARDTAGNSIQGQAQLVDCRNVLVTSDGPRVSVIGLEDVVIVVDGDEVLVTSHAGAQRVGKLDGAANQ